MSLFGLGPDHTIPTALPQREEPRNPI